MLISLEILKRSEILKNKQEGYAFAFCLFVFYHDNSKRCRHTLIKRSGGMGCVTSKNWLDSGDDPDHDSDPGIL